MILMKVWPPFSWRMVKEEEANCKERNEEIKERGSGLIRFSSGTTPMHDHDQLITNILSFLISFVSLLVLVLVLVLAHVYFGRKELHFCFIFFDPILISSPLYYLTHKFKITIVIIEVVKRVCLYSNCIVSSCENQSV